MKTHFVSTLFAAQGKNDRVKLSASQTNVLCEFFKINSKPSLSDRERLGRQLNLTPDKIKNWFQNRRAKYKSEAKENEFWNSHNIRKIHQILDKKVYPGCNNFFQSRDFD